MKCLPLEQPVQWDFKRIISFSKEVVQRSIEYKQEAIKSRGYLGHLGFTNDDNQNLDASRISHLIVDVYIEENDLIACIEPLANYHGKLLANSLEKYPHDISLRPIGEVSFHYEGKSKYLILDDFNMKSIIATRKEFGFYQIENPNNPFIH